MPAALATLPTSRTLGENSGPTISSAPAPIAAWAAWAAPSGVEWSSSTIKVTSLAPDSSTASCAALRSETPTALGLPPCVSGKITPMRTGPVPRVSPTVAPPLSGCDCTGVVGARHRLVEIRLAGRAAGRQGHRRAAETRTSAAGLRRRGARTWTIEAKADIRTPKSATPEEIFQQADAPFDPARAKAERSCLAVMVFEVNYGILSP